MKLWKKPATTLLVSVLLLAGCRTQELPQEAPIPVEAASITTMPISKVAYAHSRLEGIEEALIYVSLPGRIEQVLVRQGDSVESGQHLVRLDTDQRTTAGTAAAIAGVSAAKTNADKAGRDLDRLAKLYEAGAVSEQQLDAARSAAEAAAARLEQAEAAYDEAKTVRDNAYVTAPFSGVIGRIWARAGNSAANEPLLSISNPAGLVARILLPERDLYDLRVGLPAYFSVTALDGRSFPGVVSAVTGSVDPVSGLVPVEVRFENQEGFLRPGMTGRVSVFTRTVEDALVVPEHALRRTRSGYELALAQGDSSVIRTVETGIRNNGMVEVISGVAAGDTIIIRGNARVSQGSPIRILLP